jgi:glucose/arabinose dehydrogenase
MPLQTHLARLGAALLFGVAVAACAQPKLEPLRTTVVAQPLEHPWAMAFLPVGEPRGRLLVTERPGRMRVVLADGTLSAPLSGLPPVVAEGQGGLLDVVLHPRFETNRLVYWSYSEALADGATNSTAVARGKLDLAALTLTEVKVIFRQSPKVDSSYHFGSRLVFARDGTLFITLGDRFSRKDDAQTLDNHHGKVVRVTDDGGVPPGNPFVGRAGALPEIWSYGHRNLQGAALHPATGELWAVEHGPQGGDEVNRVLPGRNYGWPLVTYGRNYGIGTRIGEEGPKAGFEQPLRHWVPTSVAPSGLVFLTSERYPAWKGNLFMGTLRGQALVRLTLDGNRVVAEERLLEELGVRIRDVRQGPDGWLYVLTDGNNGQLLRLQPR